VGWGPLGRPRGGGGFGKKTRARATQPSSFPECGSLHHSPNAAASPPIRSSTPAPTGERRTTKSVKSVGAGVVWTWGGDPWVARGGGGFGRKTGATQSGIGERAGVYGELDGATQAGLWQRTVVYGELDGATQASSPPFPSSPAPTGNGRAC
jgi:hypothetical protein